MSWLGDVASFENFNLGQMWKKNMQDPERMFIGAEDPFSSKVWGTILNKDYTPVVDQYGGASADTYDKAKAAGINIGPGKTMHGIARTIASMYAGGAASNALGGASAGGEGLLNSANPALESMNGGTGLLNTAGEGLQGGLNAQFAGATVNPSVASSSPGILDTAQSYLTAAKPYMNAADTGLSIANKLKAQNQQPIQPVGPMSNMGGGGGPQGLATLSGQIDQQKSGQMQDAQTRRQIQQALIAKIGGQRGLIG
jgi:hypothetical protein